MKPSRLHLAALAFALPLCATVFSVWWMLRDDENRARMKAGAALNGRLVTMVAKADNAQAGWTGRLESVAEELAPEPVTEKLRSAGESEPLVRTAALLDPDGVLIFPVAESASLREREFLERSADLLAEPWTPKPSETAGRGLQSAGGSPAESGWQRFYWRDGMQLLYWKALPENGGYLLLEIERSAMLAELAASIGTPPWPEGKREGHSVVLADEQGSAFLSWPDRNAKYASVPEALHAERVQSSIALGGALQGWQFTWSADLSAVAGTSDLTLALGLLLGLVVAGSGLVAFTLLRRLDRDVREAGQRVSFVNQVSHELKTPLTNIRLYAEMLEAKIAARDGRSDAGSDSKEAQYTGIILRESARLSRLIHNVLTFARLAKSAEPGGNGMISLHARPSVPDEIVSKVIEGFSVSLAEKGMRVELSLDATETLDIDPDICEQLLGNLLSNAEKYARSGGYVGVKTSVAGPKRVLKVEVCDRGPGLPAHAAARAFQPFVRFHDRHTDGAGGAGLGLAIVRELSALHGGDAGYREMPGGGACFYFTLASQESDNHSAEDPA